jgi:hypothetical protein
MQRTYAHNNPKRVYYLSLEFLIGRSLANYWRSCRARPAEGGVPARVLRLLAERLIPAADVSNQISTAGFGAKARMPAQPVVTTSSFCNSRVPAARAHLSVQERPRNNGADEGDGPSCCNGAPIDIEVALEDHLRAPSLHRQANADPTGSVQAWPSKS